MHFNYKYIGVSLAAASLAASSLAAGPSRSAFAQATNLLGFSVQQVANTFTLGLNSNPTFMIGATTYHVDHIFGFFVLRDIDPDTLGASGSDFNASTGSWKYDSNNASTGSEAGWTTQGSAGVFHNGSQAFTFTTLNSANVQQFGYHVSLKDGEKLPNGSPTGFIAGDPAPVPEPASMTALGLGLVAIIRRRRNK